jgi:hypothetical protein
MDIRPALQIQTAIKAMKEVIVPAIDPTNKPAMEQAALVIGVLNIVAERLPLVYRYERDELARFLALAGALQNQSNELPGTSEALQALAETVEAGNDVLSRAKAEPVELERANFRLREKIGALVTAIYSHCDALTVKHVGVTVTAHAKEQLLRERAWLIGQGWEPDPQSIPALETLIGKGPFP